jgi:hypothetical protein
MFNKKQYDKKRNAAVRAKYKTAVDALKIARGCIDCGYNLHAEALDFDHLRDKVMAVSKMATWGYSWPLIEQEIMKCEVVCANCHRVRTVNRRTSKRVVAAS